MPPNKHNKKGKGKKGKSKKCPKKHDGLPNDGVSLLNKLIDNVSLDCNKKLDSYKEISDDELFKQPPLEDCPICCLPLPAIQTGKMYKTCCGKNICNGCNYSVADRDGKCPFCRTPRVKSSEEVIERTKKRVDVDDPFGTYTLGYCYYNGTFFR